MTDSSVLDRSRDALDREFPAETRSVTKARHVLRDWLAAGPDDVHAAGKTSDLLLVATELAGNAVRAKATSFRLRAWREGDILAIEVADNGPGFDAPLRPLDHLPPLDAENGRGLFLVRTLVDRCTIFTSDTGTIVRCRIKIPG